MADANSEYDNSGDDKDFKITLPCYSEKPTTHVMETIINEELDKLQLHEFVYNTTEECSTLTKQLSHLVKERLKERKYLRYKYFVQVIIGEQKDEGVHMGCRMFWDQETDTHASVSKSYDELFCVVTAHAFYVY